MKRDNLQRLDEDRRRTHDLRLAQVAAGLAESPPRISSTWFYDRRGSALFEQICVQPEYYLTRTELGILRVHAVEMAEALGRRVALVEPGSGASAKTRLLLEALEEPVAYVPVDISRWPLAAAAHGLRESHPRLRVHPVCADFTVPFEVPLLARRGARRTVVYFPGSTLGNFDHETSVTLLSRFAQVAGPDGALLVGLDTVKSPTIIERAYDDAAGVTAAFNLNALRHLNRELGTSFDLTAFEHRAPWVASHERIEMHLVARRDVTFAAGSATFELRRGEHLLTEYSHKYTPGSIAKLAAAAGLVVRRTWSDPCGWFRVLLLEPDGTQRVRPA